MSLKDRIGIQDKKDRAKFEHSRKPSQNYVSFFSDGTVYLIDVRKKTFEFLSEEGERYSFSEEGKLFHNVEYWEYDDINDFLMSHKGYWEV